MKPSLISRSTDFAIAAGAALLWLVVRATTGGMHPDLGTNGAAFQAMVREFTLKGGDKATRLSPLLPALSWLPYAATHSVVHTLVIVNMMAVGLLAYAACLLLDERRAGTPWKIAAAASCALSITFAKMAAFEPATPFLIGLAAFTLAIALAERQHPLLVSVANVGAVMALPIGLLAPLYTLARALRMRTSAIAIALVSAPAIAMWLFVQWWARGGVVGAMSDFTPHVLFGSAPLWSEPLFILFAVYFLLTSAGGLSVIAGCRAGGSMRLLRQAPEAAMLIGGVMLYALAVPGAAAVAFGFLAPVWLMLLAEWSVNVRPARAWWWCAAAIVITVVTQHSFARMDLASSLIDWQPYDVHRGSVSVAAVNLGVVWIPRFAFVATTAAVLLMLRERSASFPRATIAPSPRLRWTALAYLYAIAAAAITAYFLFGMPIQLSDSFGNLLDIQGVTAPQLFLKQVQNGAYFRPFLHLQLKLVYDLADGDYYPWFRSVQALQVLAALLMSVRLLRPARVTDAAVLPCAIAMVLGLHTFAGTITEAFPINTFLTLVVCCLAAANLSAMRSRWWNDALAPLLLAFALLTLETGILVWVLVVAGYLVGYHGISKRGVLLTTAVLGAYFVARLVFLHSGPPGLNERATGFGFGVLQPADVTARFAANPLPFYLYNIASAMMTVLFAEPRGAVWQFVGGLSSGHVEVWSVVNVLTSTLTTAVLLWYVARRASSWTRLQFSDDDRLVLLFLAILPVNALLCTVYVKDVIMSPAGVFYALAATVAIRELISGGARIGVPSIMPAWTVLLLGLISVGWGWRMLGIHYSLRTKAADLRAEWGFEDEWEAANHVNLSSPDALALKRALMDDAMWRRPAPPRLQMRWAERAFDKTQ